MNAENITAESLKTMNLTEIAWAVRSDWAPVNYAAAPYLQAMAEMDSIDQPYYQDSGRSIVIYFLSNAATWRGPVAKLVKAELKRRMK
jgi:hypothetical protein